MDFTSDSVHRGVRERAAIVGSGRAVPLALWTPEDADPIGLVLVGHGGSGHKREDYVVALARRLVRKGGFAVASIDGPVHGDRRSANAEVATLVLMEFAQAWSSDSSLTDQMVEDWTVTLDALQEISGLGHVPVGYWGLSMGTLLGLPFVAAEARVAACVLGLAGLVGPTSQRLAVDAPKVLVPTLFVVQLDDELFSTSSSLDLFRAIGTPDKRLYASPGKHRDVPSDAFHLSIEFLANQLAPAEVAAEGTG